MRLGFSFVGKIKVGYQDETWKKSDVAKVEARDDGKMRLDGGGPAGTNGRETEATEDVKAIRYIDQQAGWEIRP